MSVREPSREWPVRLVRDRFRSPHDVLRPVADLDEHLRLLDAKLVEEALEATRPGAESSELFDVAEVLNAQLWLRHEIVLGELNDEIPLITSALISSAGGRPVDPLLLAAVSAVRAECSVVALSLVWSAVQERGARDGLSANDILRLADQKCVTRGGFVEGLVHTITTYDFPKEV